MQPIFHLSLLLGAVRLVLGAFGFQEAARAADCLTRCSNETCADICEQPVGPFDPYPHVNRPAMANASLHCRGADILIIKFNPGIYVVEQSIFDDDLWDSATVSRGKFVTFRNLTAGIRYRYRVYRLLENGVSLPEISDWFVTFEVNYRPMPVKEILQPVIMPDENESNGLTAEVEFIPAEDRSCYYKVFFWPGEHDLRPIHSDMSTSFRVKIENLSHNRNNTILISSKNKERTSNETSIPFLVPSCLEIYQNLNVCAPQKVENLQAKYRHRQGSSYDLLITWDVPKYEPDNYTIELDLLNNKPKREVNVPGNATQFTFFNMELGSQYEVKIIAESPSGTSFVSSIRKSRQAERNVIQGYTLFHIVMMGLSALVTIVIMISVVLYQRHRRRNNHIIMDYNHFKTLDQKDSSLKKRMGRLSRSYGLEDCATPLIGDKCILSAESLELKGILGSGAYGIVRFGYLKDESGNIKDVAVKMLRDDPSAEDVKSFHQEIVMMKNAGQHPNIVSLFGCCTLYNQPVLVVEYCCKGDLQTYLRTIWQSMVNVASDHRARFKFDTQPATDNGNEYHSNDSGGHEPHYQNIRTIANRLYDIQQDLASSTENVTGADLLNFSRQVATGMEYLASNRIVHRDLAARNVLVCTDRVVKISDFGLSRDIYQENLYRKQGNGKLPVKWMAIEALTHQVYTTHSDVWSFGILLWEIVTMGAVPYPGIPTNTVLKLLKSGYRMERPPNCGVGLYNIMHSCWNARPQSRPSFTKLKEKLDKLLSTSSQNEYLIMCEILNESPDVELKK